MGRHPQLRLVKALLLLGLNPISASLQDQHCESLSLTSNISGLQCNASVDLIGTCWPRSPAGQLVVRPCPAFFYGVRYNTTNNGYRECLANGSWAARVNYSECQEILNEEKKSKVHYHVAVIINYLGHCISLVALLVAFVLFLRLRSIRCLRNIIHWNLISAFILRNATWFVVQLTMSPEVHQSNVVRPGRGAGSRSGQAQVRGGDQVGLPCRGGAHRTGVGSQGVPRPAWGRPRPRPRVWCRPCPPSSSLVGGGVAGLVQVGDSRLQLLPCDQLLLDVRRGLLPAHSHRAHLLHRPAAQVDVHLHRLGCALPHHCGLGHWEAVLRQREVLVWQKAWGVHRLHLPGPHDPGPADQFHLPFQHRPHPHDQAPGIHHV
ncbi:corticotropin-releasing factor receptor 1 isoform X4 [Nomascus leucogenys]|uniref:corticotropin-releasing factor receptor 1 isoform X4 n=1 Tax=Nomascus leucogenys TaxID=61853 RepID=UPI00122D9CD1|nr:corticotropin-releasing factor receptor 1 isoform X4 [Nomascus leucogenys]